MIKIAQIPERHGWTRQLIAEAIMTWCNWPGFSGVRCGGCDCEMNVLGVEYDVRCPDCNPDGRHESSISFQHNWITFERPEWGPTRTNIRVGGYMAELFSERLRKFGVGDRILLHSPFRNTGVRAMVVNYRPDLGWPGSPVYDVRIGRKSVTETFHEWRMFKAM